MILCRQTKHKRRTKHVEYKCRGLWRKRLNFEKWQWAVSFWVLLTECWLLIVDCWLLIIDCWLLIVDCWLLIVDCWLLIVDGRIPFANRLRQTNLQVFSKRNVHERCGIVLGDVASFVFGRDWMMAHYVNFTRDWRCILDNQGDQCPYRHTKGEKSVVCKHWYCIYSHLIWWCCCRYYWLYDADPLFSFYCFVDAGCEDFVKRMINVNFFTNMIFQKCHLAISFSILVC